MTEDDNILRLAGDGYDARDISLFTRTPTEKVRAVCKEAGVKLQKITKRKPFVTVVKHSPPEPAGPRPLAPRQAEPPPPKVRQNPLAFAGMWLGRRLVEKPSGYFLDDVPANLEAIMKAANAAAKKAGAEQLGHSERWLV